MLKNSQATSSVPSTKIFCQSSGASARPWRMKPTPNSTSISTATVIASEMS